MPALWVASLVAQQALQLVSTLRQNPIDLEGTYALPEAQIDRFLLKLVVPYPEADEEREWEDPWQPPSPRRTRSVTARRRNRTASAGAKNTASNSKQPSVPGYLRGTAASSARACKPCHGWRRQRLKPRLLYMFRTCVSCTMEARIVQGKWTKISVS